MRSKILLALLLLPLSIFAQQVQKQTTSNLNLRTQPSVKSSIMTVIPQGTVITMEECNCDWLPVSYNGVVGYISTKYLKNINNYGNSTLRKQKSNYKNPTNNSSYRTYTNSFGEKVQSPTRYNSPPSGATALCRDGTYSFSRNRRGTCSRHGGVAKWL